MCALLTCLALVGAPKEKDVTLYYLDSLLFIYRKNVRRGETVEVTRDHLTEIKEVPVIRYHCRRLFDVVEVTDLTMDALADWLCVKTKKSAKEVWKMKLSEVVDALDKHAPK